MIRKAASLLSASFSEVIYIVPYEQRWDPTNPQRASTLQMIEISEWPDDGNISVPDEVKGQFVFSDIKNLHGFPDVKTLIEQRFEAVLKELEGTGLMAQLPYEVSSCITAMEKQRKYIEMDEKINEATVRLVYANAIAYMICALNNYYYRVEHRDESIDDVLLQSISNRSVADYICYSIHEGRRLVMVVLETKQKFTYNGIAQALGYYLRAATSYQTLSICILLTSKSAHCILCPFAGPHGTLVNAICLKPMEFKGMDFNDMYTMLYLIGIITSINFSRQSMAVALDERFLPLSKAFQFCIQTEEEKRLEHLEALVRQYRRELAELKCRYLPVKVTVAAHQAGPK